MAATSTSTKAFGGRKRRNAMDTIFNPVERKTNTGLPYLPVTTGATHRSYYPNGRHKNPFNKSYSFALLRKVISLAVRGNCPNITSGANFRLNFSECKCNGLFTTLLCYEHGWRLFCVCFAEAILKFAYRTAHVPKVTSAT